MLRPNQPLPDPERWPFWLLVSFVVKALTLGILLAVGGTGLGDAGRLGVMWSDSRGYFDPIASLLNGNGYAPDLRMPGYGLVYLLARLVSTPPLTYDLIVLFQLALGAVTLFLLARTVFRITGSKAAFLIVFLLYALSISVQWYDAVMLTESCCTSAMILFLDRYVAWYRTRTRTGLLLAGIWLTWAIFLKPVLAPALLFTLVGLWIREQNWRTFGQRALLFLLPFLLIDGAWVARNAMLYGGLHPLTRTLYLSSEHPHPKLLASEFVIAIGGDLVWWGDPKAEVRFFNVADDQLPGHTNAEEVTLPERILTPAYTMDSLRIVSAGILSLKDPSLSDDVREARSEQLMASLFRYKAAFISEHPVQYHVLSRWLALGRYWKQNGNPVAFALSFGQLPLHLKALKLLFILLHWATLIGGAVGIWLWWKSGRDRALVILPALIVPFGLLVFPVALRLSEHRYLVPFVPFLLLAAVVGFHSRHTARA